MQVLSARHLDLVAQTRISNLLDEPVSGARLLDPEHCKLELYAITRRTDCSTRQCHIGNQHYAHLDL